jgi:ribosomal-protein-alanine N-acetyltransferase
MNLKSKEKEFPVIETDRLILRLLKNKDSKDVFSILSSENITKYYGMFPMKEVSEADQLISRFESSFREDKSIRWGIELKDSEQIIGTCGFHNWNKRHFRAEIGYELKEQFWKNGYAKEAVLAIIDYGFENMELERIEAVTYPENKVSKNMLIKLGFEHEGLLKKYAYFRNKRQDLDMFSICKI